MQIARQVLIQVTAKLLLATASITPPLCESHLHAPLASAGQISALPTPSQPSPFVQAKQETAARQMQVEAQVKTHIRISRQQVLVAQVEIPSTPAEDLNPAHQAPPDSLSGDNAAAAADGR